MRDAEMQMPAQIGDYTDFYASIHHATRVDAVPTRQPASAPLQVCARRLSRPGVVDRSERSGDQAASRADQNRPAAAEPEFGPSQSMDYELEVGLFVGPGNALGEPIPIAEAEQHIFGLCLVNDWSARDIQSWEYQPLGPFLAKSFATTISPWIVPMAALAPYRVPAAERPAGDPAPLRYLASLTPGSDGIDLTLEVYLQSASMREAAMEPVQMSRSNLRDLYWTPAQLLTHQASNGCNLRPGDLLATGTISGSEEGSGGCLLEMKHRGEPVHLPPAKCAPFSKMATRSRSARYALREGLPRIGFGECVGTIVGS